jgi:hypothetical protein
MPPDRLAAVLAAGQRRSVATGAPPGPAQREVMGNADLMTAILTSAMDPNDSGQACRLAARWCASHKGACNDDARWGQLRETVFPYTVGTSPPYPKYIKSNRQWFRMLCQGLPKAIQDMESARTRKERLAQIDREAEARALRAYERTGQMPPPYDDTNMIFATKWYDIAKLKLQVILWDRWREELQYSKQNPEFDVWSSPSQLPFIPLTEKEMLAQLDALEEQDDSASGALGGD